MFRSFIFDGKIVYFGGVPLIWSYFSQNGKAHFSLERVYNVSFTLYLNYSVSKRQCFMHSIFYFIFSHDGLHFEFVSGIDIHFFSIQSFWRWLASSTARLPQFLLRPGQEMWKGLSSPVPKQVLGMWNLYICRFFKMLELLWSK
jgi:hypothetical protein